jgi:crotonobetainyl-CoA:carnitine CoA-transferase CaiB-like acyl-CoA transferase
MMADLGATVIKVETETIELPVTTHPPVHKGHSAYYEQMNAGKKSILLDPKHPDGLATIKALCRNADVFLQNSRPGVMERLGLGYEELKESNPGLIYVSVTGFGEGNEYSGHAAYDPSIQAMMGFMPVQGGDGPPQAIVSPVADKITGYSACNALLSALLFRERNNGVGQKVVVSMVSAFASFILTEEMNNQVFQSADLPLAPSHRASYVVSATSDGNVVGLILTPKQYQTFCVAMGRHDLVADPRFTTSADLVRRVTELYQQFAPDIAALTTEEFLGRMAEVGIPFGRVNTSAEFFDSDIARKTEVYVDFEDPELGTLRHLNHPAKFSVSPVDVRRRAPRLNEHAEEIRKQFGLS